MITSWHHSNERKVSDWGPRNIICFHVDSKISSRSKIRPECMPTWEPRVYDTGAVAVQWQRSQWLKNQQQDLYPGRRSRLLPGYNETPEHLCTSSNAPLTYVRYLPSNDNIGARSQLQKIPCNGSGRHRLNTLHSTAARFSQIIKQRPTETPKHTRQITVSSDVAVEGRPFFPLRSLSLLKIALKPVCML